MQAYRPLIVVLFIALVAALVLAASLMQAMQYFMGFFFLLLAMFKLFDVAAFAKGFAKYDLIAKHSRAYAYAYPFFELALGLAYLHGGNSAALHLATVLLMSLSAAGVVRSIVRGENQQCACLGTVLNVPLSTVSVVENVGMGVMAALMLFQAL